MKKNKKITWTYGILILFFLSIFFKSFFLHPTFSDENFYFNAAKNVAQGKTPYKDFFFAHPPLQIYVLAIFYKIFNSSFVVGKVLTLIFSSLSILLLFLAAKKISNEISAFFVSILFVASPAWIAFSTISYGMWESMALLLLSFYFLLEEKLILSTTFFVSAFLFRYTTILYLPIFLLILQLRKKKKILSAFLLFFIFSLAVLIFLFILFGKEYIHQTFLYHFLKTSFQSKIQYFGMGTFFIFLTTISIFVGIKKDKLLLSLTLPPFLIDMALLLGFKIVFYHYFLLSIPFYLIGFSRVVKFKYPLTVFATLALLFISYIYNLPTFDYYLNPIHSKKFNYISNIIERNTNKNDTIFGEPVMTNYVSFVTERKIASDYFDSYIQRLKVEGVEKIVKILEKEKPRIFIEMEGYYSSLPELNFFINSNYYLVEKVEGIPNYLIYKIRD